MKFYINGTFKTIEEMTQEEIKEQIETLKNFQYGNSLEAEQEKRQAKKLIKMLEKNLTK